MRNIARLLAAALFCGALFTAAFVGAQDATGTPTAEATMEMTTEVTPEATMDMTTMPTTEATAAPSTDATAAPTTEATLVSTLDTSTTTQTGSTNGIVCDSDLILNLYIAEHYFGFDGVVTAAMNGSADTSSMVDVTTLDKGQYAALFNAPMMAVPSTTMSDDQMLAAAGMMTMDETAMMDQMSSMMPSGTDMSTLTTLNSVSVPGEDASCTTLRTELNRFFTILAFQDMQSNMNMEATAEATSSVSSSTTTGSSVNFGASLLGTNEVPGPGDPDATGSAAITIDMPNGQVCYNLTVQNLTLPATMAHIHRGAAGEAGPPVVPFDKAPDASGNAVGCVLVDAALLQEIASNPAGFYVNVHTSDFPDGAARGQLSG